MSDSEPQGCLAAILSLLGIRLAASKSTNGALPYLRRDDFLSPAELAFYRVLLAALGDRATVCPKVNLADVFFVPQGPSSQSHRNRIDRKHVDFLVCSSQTMRPVCGVELDDASHARADRQERDAFVDEVFAVAGMPLVRVPAQAGYQPATLLALVAPHLDGPTNHAPLPPPTSGPPTCPKCGVRMVERVAKKGATAGQKFFGCVNYPRCREVSQA